MHTWDLARAVGGEERLPPHLVEWITAHVEWLYDGMDESPLSPTNSFRYYGAAPLPSPSPEGPRPRLLRLMGRDPEWTAAPLPVVDGGPTAH